MAVRNRRAIHLVFPIGIIKRITTSVKQQRKISGIEFRVFSLGITGRIIFLRIVIRPVIDLHKLGCIQAWYAPLAGAYRNKSTVRDLTGAARSEEHTSELQSLMRISSAVFCLKKKPNILLRSF